MPRSKKKDATEAMTQQLSDLSIDSTTVTPSGSAPDPGPKHKVSLAAQWSTYIQKATLQDFQRLCADLGLSGDLGSKTKCRKEIKSVHVNIKQFLQSENKPDDVRFFKNRYALAHYTRRTHSFFPRRQIPKGDPLAALLKTMDD